MEIEAPSDELLDLPNLMTIITISNVMFQDKGVLKIFILFRYIISSRKVTPGGTLHY